MAGGYGRGKTPDSNGYRTFSILRSNWFATAATSCCPKLEKKDRPSSCKPKFSWSVPAVWLPSAYYLAAAGVGTLGIIDNDVVDISNLQRQILHTNDRIANRR